MERPNMRMSREAMAESHEKIVAAAARLLRERGIEQTSVGDVMKAAGMTHGGFYRHFRSKEALVAEAAQAAFRSKTEDIDKTAAARGADAAIAAYVKDYLSDGHVDNPGIGCPIAALGIEAGRLRSDVSSAFAAGVDAIFQRFVAAHAGGDRAARHAALRRLAMMVGAVVIARAVGDVPLRTEVLKACRAVDDPA